MDKQLVGQGMGGCQLTSMALQAMLFSIMEMIVRLQYFGGMCQRLRRNILNKGMKCTLKTSFDLPEAAVF